jgi:small-conductance mechanosensitive channel
MPTESEKFHDRNAYNSERTFKVGEFVTVNKANYVYDNHEGIVVEVYQQHSKNGYRAVKIYLLPNEDVHDTLRAGVDRP